MAIDFSQLKGQGFAKKNLFVHPRFLKNASMLGELYIWYGSRNSIYKTNGSSVELVGWNIVVFSL
jgi:hypothetical protein